MIEKMTDGELIVQLLQARIDLSSTANLLYYVSGELIETRLNRDIRKTLNDLDSCMGKLDDLRRAYNDSLLLMFDSVSLARSDSYWPDWESELLEFKVQLSTLKDNLQELHDVVQNGHSWAEAEYQASKRRNESCRQGERK